jgi:L-fuculose-phosphate aldolase
MTLTDRRQGRARSAPAARAVVDEGGPAATDSALRAQIVAAIRRMDERGLNRGSTGNASHRVGGGMLITPTGMGADDLGAADVVRVDRDGSVTGPWQPSSEWHFHRAVLLQRPDLNAVVHCHSPSATALACLDRGIPAFHYMVAKAGGDSVPCVPYHLFGTEALSNAVAAGMADRDACLLAHHGLVTAGETMAQALALAIEVESLAEVYLKALAVGEPTLLDAGQMAAVIDRFRGYGKAARR